jgi:sugar lactone lactonase YvrE
MRASSILAAVILGFTTLAALGMPTTAAAKSHPNPAPGPLRTVLALEPPNLPEGLVIDRQGNIYLSMVMTGEIWKITPDGTQSVLAQLRSDPGVGFTVAMAIDARGELYVAHASHSPGSATADTHGLWKIDRDGTKELLGAIPDLSGTPNQVVLGPRGNIYVSDSGLGVIWRVTRDGEVSLWLDHPLLKPFLPGDNPCNHTALGIPVGVNGLAFAKDGTLFAANEDRGVIVSIEIDPRTGDPETPEVFLQSCEDLVGLDQIAFDVRGNLYAALNTQNKLIRITPDREIEVLATAADGLAFPANIYFGTGHRAFGTTAGNRTELYISNLAFLGGVPGVQVIDVGIPGRPLP